MHHLSIFIRILFFWMDAFFDRPWVQRHERWRTSPLTSGPCPDVTPPEHIVWSSIRCAGSQPVQDTSMTRPRFLNLLWSTAIGKIKTLRMGLSLSGLPLFPFTALSRTESFPCICFNAGIVTSIADWLAMLWRAVLIGCHPNRIQIPLWISTFDSIAPKDRWIPSPFVGFPVNKNHGFNAMIRCKKNKYVSVFV